MTKKVSKQEIIAQNFYQELTARLLPKQTPFSGITRLFKKNNLAVSIEGEGVLCKCIVTCGTRKCEVHFFSNGTDGSNQQSGTQYFTYYYSGNGHVPTGITPDKEKTIEAIKSWCENITLHGLYAQFDFIDLEKRELEKIKNELFKFYPQLLQAGQQHVTGEDFNSYCLWFKHNERGCRIYYKSHKATFEFQFEWNDNLLFEQPSNDLARMGSLIKQWVIDAEKPSVLSAIYTEIDFGKIASYYEQGRAVEAEFVTSWDKIEEFYNNGDAEKKEAILQLLRTMREKGFDRTLRAKPSFYNMKLFRSFNSVLRDDQPFVTVAFVNITSAMQVSTWKGEIVRFDVIAYYDTLEKLLKSLEQEEIS